MFLVLKVMLSGLWPEIKALVIRLTLKFAAKTGDILVIGVRKGMAEADRKLPDGTWLDRLGCATMYATRYLEAEGLKAGKDFFTNDLVGMVASQVERKWAQIEAEDQVK